MDDVQLTEAEVNEKIFKINEIVKDFVKEMQGIKQQKRAVIQSAMQRIDHQKIQEILQAINNEN